MISILDIMDILTTNSKNYKRHGNRPVAADIYKGYQYMARNIVNGGEWWYNIAVAGVPVIQGL